MGFECWQTLLGRQSGLSSLNVACGGARISQFRDQLGAATAACSELGLRPGADTLVVPAPAPTFLVSAAISSAS